VLILGILSLLLILPFIRAILAGIILTMLLYPAYKKVEKRIKNPKIASLVITLLVFILIAAVLILMLGAIRNEAHSLYLTVQRIVSGGDIAITCQTHNVVCTSINNIKSFLSSFGLRDFALTALKGFVSNALLKVSNFIFELPDLALNLFVIFFITYSLLQEGPKIIKAIMDLIPIKGDYKQKMLVRSEETIRGVLYVSLVIALVQAVLATIGFYIFNSSSPLLFGALSFIAALIPFLGAGFVWFIVSVSMMINGAIIGNDSQLIRGVGLFLFGFFIVSTIDNILKPRLLGDSVKVHPIIALLGIIGGLKLLGFIGLIAGPLIMGLFVVTLEIMQKEKLLSNKTQ